MDRRITTFAVLALMWLGMATIAVRVVEPVAHHTPKTGLERLFARQVKPATVTAQTVSADR